MWMFIQQVKAAQSMNEKRTSEHWRLDQSPRKKNCCTEMWPAKMVSSSAENSDEDKIDPPIHIGYFHSGGATTWTFIVDGAKDINSFVMCLPVPWSMVVHLTTRHGRKENLLMSTSHFMTLWTQVSWTPRVKWLEQHFRATRNVRRQKVTMFSSDVLISPFGHGHQPDDKTT